MQRSIGAVVAILMVLVGLGIPGRAVARGAEEELIQLERDWCSSVLKRDVVTFGRILADDYTGVTSRGVVETKADALADLKDQANSIDACVHSNVKVRLYGDAAVVTGLGTRSGTRSGVAFKDRQTLWIDTFVKKDGRWQCVASQGTVVEAQQK